ncbi:MAG: phosphatidylserine decarboxylase, partial [Bacteroidota bacterium]
IQDYHRFHFPVSGVVKEIRNIAEQDAVGGIITWDPSIPRYMLDCTVPSWQAIETRGCVIIDTEDFGLVAVLPIGMSQICSVKFENNIQVGTRVKKGDMMGCFLFGGSDIVMIFQPGAGFELEPSGGMNGQSYQHILMGEKYGVLTVSK